MRTAITLPSPRANRHHHRAVVLDLDALDDSSLKAEELLPYASSAHAATALSSSGSNRCRKPEP
jgi:predicted transcriptional regulator